MTVQEILLDWIETALALSKGPVRITSHDIHSKCRSWGNRVYGQVHLASTYGRRWRRLREGQQTKLTQRGVKAVVKTQQTPQGEWIITPQHGATVTNHETKTTTTITTKTHASGS